MPKFRQSTEPVHFENLGMRFYEQIAFRAPRAGEYYLSGAIIEAYLAPNDLTSRFHVVRPTHKAVKGWTRQPLD